MKKYKLIQNYILLLSVTFAFSFATQAMAADPEGAFSFKSFSTMFLKPDHVDPSDLVNGDFPTYPLVLGQGMSTFELSSNMDVSTTPPTYSDHLVGNVKEISEKLSPAARLLGQKLYFVAMIKAQLAGIEYGGADIAGLGISFQLFPTSQQNGYLLSLSFPISGNGKLIKIDEVPDSSGDIVFPKPITVSPTLYCVKK